jgi:hypothetical protein
MATNNNDRQEQLNKAMATLKAGGSVYLNKYSLARMVDGKIIVFNPKVTQLSEFQAGNASLTKKKLAAAIAAGKVSVITQAQLAAGLNPTPSVPKPPANAKPKKKVTGSADDDKGKKESPKVKVRKDADPELSPGKRLKNPLGALTSYNYQLSLYMVTPDALEIFKENGYRDINKLGVMSAAATQPIVDNQAVSAGAYIVAQTGGVNNTFEQRAPSFSFDYTIDQLQFEIAGPKDTGSPAAEYDFQFVITEPYGFSFISNLRRAADAIKDYNDRLNKKKAAVAKKKAAAQQQRTRRRNTVVAVAPSRRLPKGGVGGSGVTSVDSQAGKRGNYYNTRFQSNNDILAGVRGTKPGSRPLPKGGKAGGRAAKDSGYRILTEQFDKEQAKKTAAAKAASAAKGSGKPSGKGSSTGTPTNATRQLFILGIRFYGYNASGQPVKGTDTTAANNSWGGVIDGSRQEIDPGNNSYALFERYYPIMLNEMTTVVDGRETRYNCKAQSTGMQALGTKRGIINNKMEFTAETVGEALDNLMSRLNKEQQKLNNNTGSGYSYDIKYQSAYDADRIRSAKIVSKADLDKYKWPGSGAKNTKESNVNTETQKGQKPKNNARKITLAEGTPILQAINQIIAQSAFLQDALRTVYTTALEPDQDKEGLPELDLSGKKTIEWFHCTPDTANMSWDEKRADWVYDLNYILNIYDTPVLDTAYTNPGKKYYGPVKRYEYWYSGTNTEIRSYKQTLNNDFYSQFLDPDFVKNQNKNANKNGGENTQNASGGSGNGAGVTTPLVDNQRTGEPTQGKQGLGMEAQNTYLSSLFSPSAQATAEITILGDPDWLMSTKQTLANESTVYNKFYGNDGYSISPAGGQVFFEIDFKEAIDYKSGGQDIPTKDGSGVTGAPGTMSINSSILFWKDPKGISSLVRGLSYSLTTCRHTFRNGLFEQVLKGNMTTFGDSGANDDGKARENKGAAKSNSGPNKGNGNATTSSRGLTVSDYGLKAKGGRTSGRGAPGESEASRIRASQRFGPNAKINQSDKRNVRGGSNSGASSNSGAKREAVVDPQTGQPLGTVTRTNNGFET